MTNGFYNWGLSLPKQGVSRRIISDCNICGRMVLCELKGPGCIRKIQITGVNIGHELVLRIYFDGRTRPNVETPLAEFFGIMHNLSEISESPQRSAHKERPSYKILNYMNLLK